MLARAAVVVLGLAAASVRVEGQFDDMDFEGEPWEVAAVQNDPPFVFVAASSSAIGRCDAVVFFAMKHIFA